MSKRKITTKAGFTIIEVVLVLAIAGLIFMMVFLALPALQRAQRDTQRSDDIARLQAAINSYQANNRGRLPEGNGIVAVSQDTGAVNTDKSTAKNWASFYTRYLLVGKGTASDTFEDPSGGPYSLFITECGSAVGAGANCPDSLQVANKDFDSQASGTGYSGATADASFKNVITIVRDATCNGEDIVKSTGARKIAIAYKKEGGGSVCLAN